MKKTVSGLLALVLLAGLLFTCGCPEKHTDYLYTPVAVSDGTGGAFAVYEAYSGDSLCNLYARHLDSDGNILWGEKGVFIADGYKNGSSFKDSSIIPSGDDGIIITWCASLTKEKTSYVNFITRLDSQGNILWQRQQDYATDVISDGFGGVILIMPLVQEEDEYLISRIDVDGNYPWEAQQPSLKTGGSIISIKAGADGAGGVILVWEEVIPATKSNPAQPYIKAQRISSVGDVVWAEPVVIASNNNNILIEDASVTRENTSGAVIAWQRYPQEPLSDDSPQERLNLFGICLQKINNDGGVLWPADSLSLPIVENAGFIATPHSPTLVTDDSGGIIVIWEDLRNDLASIYAQKVSADGVIQWQPGGVKVCYLNVGQSFSFRQIVSDGAGGAIVACRFTQSDKGILIQKISASGDILWQENGMLVVNSGVSAFCLSSDREGGALVTWGIDDRAYIQKIDAAGNPLWGTNGICISS